MTKFYSHDKFFPRSQSTEDLSRSFSLELRMAAVCLKAKSFTETDAWSGVFTDFSTEVKSCLFMKQLTRTCISTILYLRKVLPDDHFEAKNFEGITLKLLKSKKGADSVLKLEKWLEGAFEAMEKKYLKRLMLDIQDTESDKSLEIYTMTFNYNNAEYFLDTSQKDRKLQIPFTKLNTIKLLQMCYAVTETYSSLPPKVKLSMRLSYYDTTPLNYQPNGYKAWQFVEPKFPTQARSIEIGATETQYHFFKFTNKSCLNDNFFKLQEMEDETENATDTLPLGITNKSENTQSFVKEKQSKVQRKLTFDKVNTSPKISSNKKEGLLNQISEKRTKPKLLNDTKVRCACLSTEKTTVMFQCLNCKFMAHAECFGILQLDPSKKIRFYCHLCHQKEPNFKCHDKVMTNLNNSSDQQKLSVLRKILRHCTLPHIFNTTLKKMEKIAGIECSTSVVNVVLNKMTELGIAIRQPKKKTLLLDKQVLAVKLVHYFYKTQRSSQSQFEVSKYNLRAENKIKYDFNPAISHQKSKQSEVALQDFIYSNSQASEHSCDIFS